MDIDDVDPALIDWRDTAETMQQEITRLEREVARLRALADRRDREQAYYADQLMAVTTGLAPLCACAPYPVEEGPQQDCPIHGDGVTFVAIHRQLASVALAARTASLAWSDPSGVEDRARTLHGHDLGASGPGRALCEALDRLTEALDPWTGA